MSGQKTEKPTAKKIREARKEGQVAHSKDVTQLALMIALFGLCFVAGPAMVQKMADLLLLPLQLVDHDWPSALPILLYRVSVAAAGLLLPFVLILLLVVVLVERLQTGPLFAVKAVLPKAERLDPVANAKNLFSSKSLFEFFKSAVKVTVLGLILASLLSQRMGLLFSAAYGGPWGILVVLGRLLGEMLLYVGAVFGVIALADMAWQKLRHEKDLMMEKHEVKRDHKEQEGDPFIKDKRKSSHRELLDQDNAGRTRAATVVVVNPTHIAVALRYVPTEMPLPVVLAKGSGPLAGRIRSIAEAQGIPVLRNVALARELWTLADIDQFIPAELLKPVAELIRALEQQIQER